MSGITDNNENDNIINEDIVLNTLPIKIILSFNSQFKITDTGDVDNGVEFNYGLISKNPVLAGLSDSSKYKLPYFTNNVMYPEDVLLVNGPAFAVEFFFDKERFEQMLLKYASNTYVNDKTANATDPNTAEAEALNDNATFNVNLMLRILLPISSDFGFALTSSYHRYIQKDFVTNIFPLNTYDINNLFNNTKWIIDSEGKQQYVQNVIWASSILDNPQYFYLLYVYNNSLVRRRNLTNQVKDDLVIKVLSLMNNLYMKMQPTPIDATAKNLFDLIKNDLNEKSNTRTSEGRKRTEYDDLIKTLQKEIGNNDEMSNTLNEFIKQGNNFLFVKEENTYVINKSKVSDAIFKDEKQYKKITDIISAITRMYVAIHEYRESANKSTTGIKQFNFDSLVAPLFDKAYRDCIEVKAMLLIRRFIEGNDPYMDLNEKTTSDQDKTIQELDIIKYIKTANPIYREINDAISKVMKNLYPPIRESLNRALQKELADIKIKAQKESTRDRTITSNNTCVDAKNKSVFLRDVYSRYFKSNAGYSEFDEKKLFTGVGIYTSPEGARNFEIYVVVDTLDKEKYDNGIGAKCLVKEDVVINSFLNAVSNKSKDKIGFVREHKALNNAVVVAPTTGPTKSVGRDTQKQKGGNQKPSSKTRRRPLKS